MQRVEFRLSESCIDELDEIAHALSEPGPEGTVTRADVLREAAAEFVSTHDGETALSHGRVGGGSQTEVSES
jgi:DNA-binding transcriptional ArsR family regulator